MRHGDAVPLIGGHLLLAFQKIPAAELLVMEMTIAVNGLQKFPENFLFRRGFESDNDIVLCDDFGQQGGFPVGRLGFGFDEKLVLDVFRFGELAQIGKRLVEFHDRLIDCRFDQRNICGIGSKSQGGVLYLQGPHWSGHLRFFGLHAGW